MAILLRVQQTSAAFCSGKESAIGAQLSAHRLSTVTFMPLGKAELLKQAMWPTAQNIYYLAFFRKFAEP